MRRRYSTGAPAQVEIGTPVCRTLDELRAHLVHLRRRLADYQQVAREQVLCGAHVHVGISDPEAAIQTMNRAQAWLAPLLALSTNSPFWLGADTGYASYRTQLWRRWPTAESAGTFASRAEYDALVASLVKVGMIQDATHIWWDLRPSARYPTIEFRVGDVAATVDEAVMVAGLAGQLVDLAGEQLVPAYLLVERFLPYLRPDLDQHKEWEEVAQLVAETAA